MLIKSTAKRPKQIVAMGGGGFSMEPRNPRLDRYVLSLTGKSRPRVCFVPTASADSVTYTARFHRAFNVLGCITTDLPLFRRDTRDPVKHLLAQDVIYVGGGNTANLLAIWRVHGIDRAMREAWRRGIILCGVSAGMICWFECSVTDSFGPLNRLNDGLRLLPGSACPHYDGEGNRRPMYHRLIKNGFPAGFAADDGAAIHFVGRKVHRCVSSRNSAQVYRVERMKDRVVETPLQTEYLK
jgi:dipeptidase E